MSEYGPPTGEQVRAYYHSQERVARWVSTTPSPMVSGASSPISRPSSRATTSRKRTTSLPPPPPGFKYGPASTPIVYKTQEVSYTVIPGNTTKCIITHSASESNRSKTHSSSKRHSTPPTPPRHQSYPQSSSKHKKHSSSHTSSSSRDSKSPSRHSSSKPKEKPLLQRLFSFGSNKSRERRNSTGGGGVAVKW